MPQQTEVLAILFADISGSTMLYESLGNRLARQRVAHCIAVMSGPLAAHRGTLIKTIGDEIMCTFPSVETALHAACDMQDAVELRHRVRHIRRASIKGRQASLDLYQVAWRADDGDRVRIGNPAQRKPEGRQEELLLRHRDQQFTVSERNSTATLGRGEACAIAVRDEGAAGRHAIVEYQLGKFFVSDRSAEGTYIQFSGGDTVHIVGEDAMLHGSGVILLGRPFSEDPAGIIEFSVQLAQKPG